MRWILLAMVFGSSIEAEAEPNKGKTNDETLQPAFDRNANVPAKNEGANSPGPSKAGTGSGVEAPPEKKDDAASKQDSPAGGDLRSLSKNSETEARNTTATDPGQTLAEQKAQKITEEKARREFAGVSFGVAIGVTVPLIANRRIEEAVIVPDGDSMVVRATKRRNASARIMLETHYFFPLGNDDLVGIGPVMVIQPGTEEIVEGAGIGAMIGFRRSKETSDSFNAGVGIFMEPSVKDLGEGVEEDKPLPEGEKEIRFQVRPAVSLLLIGSFAF